MGQLVVGLGGSALANAFLPAPFSQLATMGFALLGQVLFPPDPIRIEGPRRNDLKVSSSTYGRPIIEGFGTDRAPGILIDATDIRETEVVTEVGGKGSLGGPTGEQVEYIYDVDAAFAFGNGEAEAVLRLFADGKVFADYRDPATSNATLEAVVKPGVTVRIYLGTETQLRDPVLVAKNGTDKTPAYRGTIYVVLEGFVLTDYGNRIPQITAEIAWKASSTNTTSKSTDLDDPLIDRNGLWPDYKRGLVYTFDAGGDGADNTGIRVYDKETLTEIRTATASEMNLTQTDISSNDAFLVSPHTGRIYIAQQANAFRIDTIDPDTLLKIGTAGEPGGIDFNHGVYNCDPAQPDIAGCTILEEFACYPTLSAAESGTQDLLKIFLVGHGAVTDGPMVVDVSDPNNAKMVTWQNGSLPATAFLPGVAEPPGIGKAVYWEVSHELQNNDVELFRWRLDWFAELYVEDPSPCELNFRGVEWNLITTFTSAVWGNDASTATAVQGPIYDETDSNLIFYIRRTSSSQVWKWDVENGVILWNVELLTNHRSIGIRPNGTRVRNGMIGFTRGGSIDTYIVLDTMTGDVLESGSTPNWWNLNSYFWDDTSQCFYSEAQNSVAAGAPEALEFTCVGRKTGLGEPLDEVVAYLSGDNVNGAGLLASEYDVTDLASDTVRGYIVSREMPVKQALEPLMVGYDFDGAEVDDKMLWKKRNSISVATITQADILRGTPLVGERRIQEPELPFALDLNFKDKGMDYQENVARAKRHVAPFPTMFSRHEQSLDLAIVFTATESLDVVERILYTAWSQRVTLTFGLTNEFKRLVSMSVVTLVLDSGTTFLLRIVGESVGLNQTQMYEAVVQDSEPQLSSGTAADTSEGFAEDVLPLSTSTKLCLIDAPFLRDEDSTQRLTMEIKYAMGGFRSGWKAGTLWESDDALNFSQIGRVTAAKNYGIVRNKLPTGYFAGTDRSTILDVQMIEGALQTVTLQQFRDYEQVAIIGNPILQNWEYVAYRDATQNANGTWNVSHLRRGRRGTDSPDTLDAHGNAELFIVADRAWIERILYDLADLNALKYFKGVGRNSLREQEDTHALTITGGSLKPFRPYQIEVSVDGSDNVDITFERGNRLTFERTNSLDWNAGLLSEDSEIFDIEFLDQPGGSVIDTLTDVGRPAEWTKAEIIAAIAVGTGATTLDVGSSTTFTRASGDFGADGFVAGQTIESQNFTDGANNGIFTVAIVAALTLTIEETTLVTESGTADEEIDAIRGSTITLELWQKSTQVGRGYSSGEITLNL